MKTAVKLRHQLIARLHHGDFLLRVQLLHVGGHLHTDSSTTNNYYRLGFLDVCLVFLEVEDGGGFVVVAHGCGLRETRACCDNEVLEWDLLQALPVTVEVDVLGLYGENARLDDCMLCGIGGGGVEAGVGDEGFLFVAGEDGESGLRCELAFVSLMIHWQVGRVLSHTNAKRWWK